MPTVAVKPANQLKIGRDGVTLRCGQCPAAIGTVAPVEAGSARMRVHLMNGYTRPNADRWHFAPTDRARRDYRAAQSRASRGDPDAQRSLREMTTTSADHDTQANYLHEDKLRPLVRSFFASPGTTIVTVECISCGTVCGTTQLV